MAILSNQTIGGIGAAAAASSPTILNSLRLRASASAYLSWTPSGAPTSRRIGTISVWVKRARTGSTIDPIFGADQGSSYDEVSYSIGTTDCLSIITTNGTQGCTRTGVTRDPGAFQHVLAVYDTTQATAANRLKIYLNGVLQDTNTVTTSQNRDMSFLASGVAQYIGRRSSGSSYFDGYLAQFCFVDGQALTPSSFGAANTNGEWKPLSKATINTNVGTWGNNGFFLDFADTTNTTTLGYDVSGKGNHWTCNNVSLTAGVTYDAMIDSPTNGTSGTRPVGNYATLSPINHVSTYSFPLSNANLTASGSAAVYKHALATHWFDVTDSTGFYFEFDTIADYYSGGGLTKVTNINSSIRALTNGGAAGYDWAVGIIGPNAFVYNNGSGGSTSAACTASSGTVFGCFVRSGKVWFRDSSGWITGNPNTDTSPLYSGLTGTYTFCLTYEPSGSTTANANFGQRPFSYTPPTGAKALCTTNLTQSAVDVPSEHMDVALYTGNGSSQSVTSLDFQPDLTWIKVRSTSIDHVFFDAVRGATKQLESPSTVAESTQAQGLSAFLSNGFTVGSNGSVNGNTSTYVAWNWKANGAGSSNTAGTITSTVSANTTAGISIVKYTLGSPTTGTVGHGLGKAPSLIIVKKTDATGNWNTYHSSIGATGAVYLDSTGATVTSINFWNNTAPTTTVFSVNSGGQTGDASTKIAYCFAEIDGFSKAFTYTGNNSSDGVFVWLGFRPRWILIKRTDSADNWNLYDTARNTYNTTNAILQANNFNAEVSGNNIDIVSNGFKARTTAAGINGSGTYIGFAFAEYPFAANSNAR